MKEKGFTLIELLAVIVILAIIALIATPIILNIIKDSKEESNKRSVDMYAKAIQNAIAKDQLDGSIGVVGSFSTSTLEDKLKVEYEGNVACDIIEIYADGTMYLEKCKVNGKTIEYTYGKKASFADDSWETIAKNVKAGYMYNVGDTKEVSLTGFTNKEKENETTYTVRIANNTAPEECNTEGFSQTACGFVIEFEDIITEHMMHPSNTYIEGYPESAMYIFLKNNIYNALSKDLRKIIKDTKVVSSHGPNNNSNFISIDKLYLLSPKEVYGKDGTTNLINYDTAEMETRQLDYYLKKEVTTDNYQEAIKIYNGNKSWWWFRSIYSNSIDSTGYFYSMWNYGGWNGAFANSTCGIAPAFRIG